jgi:hypothetical protein
MKKLFILFTFLSCVFISCKKTTNGISDRSIPDDVLAKLKAQGYSTENVISTKDGYEVEGDMFVSNENLNNSSSSLTLRIAETEQYRSTNLLSVPRTVPISLDQVTFGALNASNPTLYNLYQQAITIVIARYNSLNLNLKLAQGSGKGILVFSIDNTSPDMQGIFAIGPGFPTSSGGMASGPVRVNTNFIGGSPNVGFLTWLIAHEVGHCIGFRHTDYLNSTPSCGYLKNESANPDGAILITGTPTTDPSSWMVTCLDPSTDRNFDGNDVIALRTVFGCPPPQGTVTGISWNVNTTTLSWNALSGATSYTVKIVSGPYSSAGKTAVTSTNSLPDFFNAMGIYGPLAGTYTLTVSPSSSCGVGSPASFTAFMSGPP